MHQGHHQLSFVLFSILVAVLGSWTALDLQRQVRTHSGRIRKYWLISTSLAMGTSIFSMHFMAMLGFDLGVPVRYDPALTVGSLIIAVAATAFAFSAIQAEKPSQTRIAGAALAMGSGIAIMHYMGMAAMRAPASIHYDPVLVFASFAIAVGVAWAALQAALQERGVPLRLIGALVLGLAISSMHYTAMEAVTFTADESAVIQGGVDPLGLELGIGVGTMSLLFLALLSAMFDRRFEALALREAGAVAAREAHLREVLTRMPLGVAVMSRNRKGDYSFRNNHAEALIGATHPADLCLSNPDGKPLSPHQHPIWRVLEHGEILERELVRTCCHGDGERFLEISAAPIPSAAGDREELVLILQDVTSRVEAEQTLQQAQKLETLGQLTGGVAHDFNNLLTPIIGGLELVSCDVGSSPRARKIAENALQAASKASTLVQRLLAFARRQTLQPQTVDIQQLLADLEDLLARSIGPDTDIRSDTGPNLIAKVDPGQLELAILNLVVNARDAMPEGGEISISAVYEKIGPYHVSALPEGDYVRVSVADTGEGMDEETLRRAVEPFFSTKEVGKGTGLGLSMVHGLAVQSSGALRLSSKPGVATRADLWFPFTAEPAETPPLSGKEQGGPVSGTILVVDDEELVRYATAEMLRAEGYRIVEATSAQEALRFLEERPDIDMLVTDHLMPGKTGVQLVEEVGRRWPTLPTLIITGYTVPERFPQHITRLVKPFRKAEIATAVAELLRGAPANVIHLPTSKRHIASA